MAPAPLSCSLLKDAVNLGVVVHCDYKWYPKKLEIKLEIQTLFKIIKKYTNH